MSAEEAVRAELEAWSSLDAEQIVSHLAPDAVLDMGPRYGTFSGHEAIRNAVAGFIKGWSECDIEVRNLAVAGNVVMTERIDRFVRDGRSHALPVMGTFEVVGDKITSWREYFHTPTDA